MIRLRSEIAFLAFAAVSVAIGVGCQSVPRRHEKVPKTHVTATAPVSSRGRVSHVVLLWLKNPGDAVARQALLDAAKTLRTIPGVVDVRTGTVLPSTRPVVDSTFDVGLVITFTDETALADYANHPTHLRLMEDVLKPNVDHYVVYDFAAK